MAVDIQRLRDDAEGARGVADDNPEILRTADNLDAAATQLEAAGQQRDRLLEAIRLVLHTYGYVTREIDPEQTMQKLAKVAEEIEGKEG